MRTLHAAGCFGVVDKKPGITHLLKPRLHMVVVAEAV